MSPLVFMLLGLATATPAPPPAGAPTATSTSPTPPPAAPTATTAPTAAAPVPDGGDIQVTPFRTDVRPRVDQVFGGVAALRTAIDEFLALEGDMKKARDDLSVAVHEALAQLRPLPSAPPGTSGNPAPAPSGAARSNVPGSGAGSCSPGALAAQAKARESGRRFLALGRRFEARYREIRRGLTVGDTVALTPDYRWKAGRARELYTELLRDYQEMRVAFHDQLDAELRHAGCATDAPAKIAGGGRARPSVPSDSGAPDPENPEDWTLAAADAPLPALPTTPTRPARVGGENNAAANRGAHAGGKGPDSESGPAIWIEIDNSRCARPSAFTLDGQPVAPIPAAKKVQIRTRAGPHALCVLPATEKRACGATGTVRQVYLFEGWSMAVRCTK
jgi:hypothetical protein